jgi:hypothetical protein
VLVVTSVIFGIGSRWIKREAGAALRPFLGSPNPGALD